MTTNFFSQPFQYKKPKEEHSPYDVVLVTNCEQLREGKGLCEQCYKAALTEAMRNQTLNHALDFINHQVNLYSDPLQFLKDMQDFWTEVDSRKDSINSDVYYRYKLIFEQGITQLQQPKTNSAITQKIIWQRDPDLFFVIFSSLYEEGFMNIKQGSNDLKPMAETLFKAFQVNSKIGGKDEYQFNSFHQNLKPTGSRQADVNDNIQLKKKVKEFLKTLSK